MPGPLTRDSRRSAAIAWHRATRDSLHAAAIRWFPERELMMRSEGQVRFARITTRAQVIVAGMMAALVLGWVGVLGWALLAQAATGRDARGLLDREAAVASAESRVARYRANLNAVAQDLQRRQAVLEKAVQSALGNDPAQQSTGTVSDSGSETARTVRKISQVLPEASGLAQVEERQIALAERLTRWADAHTAQAAGAIRQVGLDPNAMIGASREGMGGPLIRFDPAPRGAGPLDPRFVRLTASLARMDMAQAGLDRVPNAMPASLDFISSGFGARTDPIDGGAAFHPGLDFRGPIGAPIHAAAAGTVSFAGQRSGYGNCVEISHGNGLVTRYAHMSRILARPGERVATGTEIGAIGSTGRSTGPHLHFEVRINDRPVNPRRFLDRMPRAVLAARGARMGPDHG